MLRAALVLTTNLFNLWRSMIRAIVKSTLKRFVSPPRRFVKVKLPGGLALAPAPKHFGPIAVGFEEQGDYWRFTELLQRVAEDPDVEGVYYRADRSGMGLAEVEAIARALGTLRSAGKRVVCHVEQAMLTDYLLACAADTVLMTPPGRLYTFGLRMDLTFLGEALARVGVRAQFIHIGRFKTAAHRFTKIGSTVSQNRMMNQLMDGLSGSVLRRIASGRKIDGAVARGMFDVAPMAAREARNVGLIDVCAYRDQVVEVLKSETEAKHKVTLVPESSYMRATTPLRWRSVVRKPPEVAVMSMTGMIMMGTEGLPKQFRKVITPKPNIALLGRLRKDESVKAVVVHIDSPGGAALASDLIWRHIAKLAKEKPVVACLGNVAASGGYYLAVGATQIVALPDSLTGSIGVIAGKLSGGELLGRLGVGTESISHGETSTFTSLARPLSEREIDNLRRDIRAFYLRFLCRVAEGRKLEHRRVHRLARGRVYVGVHAKSLGLVDQIGDLEDAIDLVCQLAEVARAKARIGFHQERAGGLGELIKELRGGGRDTRIGLEADTYEGEPGDPRGLSEILAGLVPRSLEERLAVVALLRTPTVLALWPWQGPLA